MKNAFDTEKTAYQAFTSERARILRRKKKLEGNVATLQVEVPRIKIEAEEQRGAHEQLLAAVASGAAPEAALDDMESTSTKIELHLKRKTSLLKTAQDELNVLRAPGPSDVRVMLGRLGKAHCLMQLEKRGKDIDKLRTQLVELFGAWGFSEFGTDKSWENFLKVVIPQPDKAAFEGACDGFIKTVAQPIEKAALASLEDAA